jgi:hypothetical protein
MYIAGSTSWRQRPTSANARIAGTILIFAARR